MKIFINDKEIKYSLEKEKNGQEVYRQMLAWGEDSKLILTQAVFNGEEVLDDNSLYKIPVDQLEEVRLYFQSLFFFTYDAYGKVLNYLEKIHVSLVDRTLYSKVSSLKDSLVWLKDNIEKIFDVLKLGGDEGLDSLIKDLEILIFKAEVAEVKTDILYDGLSKSLTNIILCLKSYDFLLYVQVLRGARGTENETTQAEYLEQSLDLIQKLKNKGIEIATQLQTGKDIFALKNIEYYSFGLQVLINGLSTFSKDGGTDLLIEKIDRMNHILKDVESAFTNKDFVLIGDLVEYEMEEKLEDITKVLSHLK